MDYSGLTVDQLFGRYFIKEDERASIGAHVSSLTEDEIKYFEFLKSSNDTSGESFAALASIKKSAIFQVDETRYTLYDSYSFISSKGHIDALLSNCENQYEIAFVIDNERAKAETIILELGQNIGQLRSFKDIKCISAIKKEVSEYIVYLNSLSATPAAGAGANINPEAEGPTKVSSLSSFPRKLTHRALALFCFYLQEKKSMEHFENMEGGKEKGYKSIATKYGFTSPTSWKALQQHYNEISNPRSGAGTRARIDPKRIENLKQAIIMLADYPEALKTAEEELKTALLKVTRIT